jgi:CO/xanthine dehydrogenase FAD-binding subunit
VSVLRTGYVRPTSLPEALQLLAQPGARPMGGGTDLAGQLDRGIGQAATVVDLQALDLGGVRADGDGVVIGATATLSDLLAAEGLLGAYTAVLEAAAQAASPLLRNVGTVAGNLCQHTRCWYYRGPEWTCWLGGGDTCFAQVGDHRKHGLQAGDCISAHPSDLAPALIACGATVQLGSAWGDRDIELVDLYRRPTATSRSLVDLEPGEIVLSVTLPAPPDSSVYLRAGERQGFSFPLVGLAAARHGLTVSLCAAGVANVPHVLDAADPLAGLDGHPQSAWKRTVLATLVERARATVAA